MIRWEHHTVKAYEFKASNNTPGAEPLLAEVNRLGREGWELVAVEGGILWLKREASCASTLTCWSTR